MTYVALRTLANPPGRTLRRVAASYRYAFVKVVSEAMRDARSIVDFEALVTALRAFDMRTVEVLMYLPEARVERTLTTAARKGEKLSEIYLKILNAAAESVRCPNAKCLTTAFDKTNEQAVMWAENHAAELVVEITDESRAAVRSVILRSFNEGIPPRQAALMIRDAVSLTEKQANAVVNLHQRILTSPGNLVRAGKIAIRVPQGGFATEQLDRVLSSYSDRLLAKRAQMIARTETMTASNQGQEQLWNQAVQRGHLSGRERRVWMIGPKPCSICEGLEGTTASLRGTFDGGITGPPAHVGCVCTTGLVMA
jgi:hypothetical protein